MLQSTQNGGRRCRRGHADQATSQQSPATAWNGINCSFPGNDPFDPLPSMEQPTSSVISNVAKSVMCDAS